MTIYATWTVELNCECPNCEQQVDLLDFEDFWDGRRHLEIAETGTRFSENVDVTCPNCRFDFFVDLVY